jgi:hypothetical protein
MCAGFSGDIVDMAFGKCPRRVPEMRSTYTAPYRKILGKPGKDLVPQCGVPTAMELTRRVIPWLIVKRVKISAGQAGVFRGTSRLSLLADIEFTAVV